MSYLLKSRTSFYSFLFTLPLFFLYEANIVFLSWDDILVVRNGADFLMRNILESFEIDGDIEDVIKKLRIKFDGIKGKKSRFKA